MGIYSTRELHLLKAARSFADVAIDLAIDVTPANIVSTETPTVYFNGTKVVTTALASF